MEILDIVNEKDEIVGNAQYEKIHGEKLMHRVVSAILINDAGEILLQLRSADKSAYPLHWTFSVGGHVRHGEDYLQAIVREGEEEVETFFSAKDFVYKGKQVDIEHFGAKVMHTIYEIQYDGPIQEMENEEVAAVQFVDFPTLKKMIAEKKELLHPSMVTILQAYYVKELT